MKFLSKIAAVACAFVMGITGFPVFADADLETVNVDSLETTGDCIWKSPEDMDIPFWTDDEAEIEAQSTLPSSVDNSTSAYFPPIGSQGEMGSCTAWATTYYQYTYEVNKLKGVVTDETNIYSPAWTYNYLNGGSNQGTSMDIAYEILRDHGAMKLADYPYATKESEYSYEWSTNKMKAGVTSEALNMNDYVPELGCTMAEFVENELGEDSAEVEAEYETELAAMDSQS